MQRKLTHPNKELKHRPFLFCLQAWRKLKHLRKELKYRFFFFSILSNSFCVLDTQLKKVDNFILAFSKYILLNKTFFEQKSSLHHIFAAFCLKHIKNLRLKV